jgi:hypothetical protein
LQFYTLFHGKGSFFFQIIKDFAKKPLPKPHFLNIIIFFNISREYWSVKDTGKPAKRTEGASTFEPNAKNPVSTVKYPSELDAILPVC